MSLERTQILHLAQVWKLPYPTDCRISAKSFANATATEACAEASKEAYAAAVELMVAVTLEGKPTSEHKRIFAKIIRTWASMSYSAVDGNAQTLCQTLSEIRKNLSNKRSKNNMDKKSTLLEYISRTIKGLRLARQDTEILTEELTVERIDQLIELCEQTSATVLQATDFASEDAHNLMCQIVRLMGEGRDKVANEHAPLTEFEDALDQAQKLVALDGKGRRSRNDDIGIGTEGSFADYMAFAESGLTAEMRQLFAKIDRHFERANRHVEKIRHEIAKNKDEIYRFEEELDQCAALLEQSTNNVTTNSIMTQVRDAERCIDSLNRNNQELEVRLEIETSANAGNDQLAELFRELRYIWESQALPKYEKLTFFRAIMTSDMRRIVANPGEMTEAHIGIISKIIMAERTAVNIKLQRAKDAEAARQRSRISITQPQPQARQTTQRVDQTQADKEAFLARRAARRNRDAQNTDTTQPIDQPLTDRNPRNPNE